MSLYKDIFGAKILGSQPLTKEAESQFGLPADFDYANSTMHGEIEIFGNLIYMGDSMQPAQGPNRVEILFQLESKAQIEEIYAKVKAKGFTIKMELQKMFWGAYYAYFLDPDGIGWQLNYQESPQPEMTESSPPEKAGDKIKAPKKAPKKSPKKK